MTSLRPVEDPAELAPSEQLDVAVGHLLDARCEGIADIHRIAVLEFIAAHPDAASRSCAPGHLTGSALVVDATGTRTLLMHHRKLGRWFQPGGHADGDTNLAAVALKEAYEETGIAGLQVYVPAIDVDIHEVRPPAEEPHLHLDTRFLVVAPLDAVEQGNDESLALRWVTESQLDELEPALDASTRRLISVGLGWCASLRGD